MFGCFIHCKQCTANSCNQVCPRHADDFAARMIEVQGFNNTNIRSIDQSRISKLPKYVPVIYSRTRRFVPLQREMVALPLWRIIGGSVNRYDLLVSNEKELRDKFMIAEDTSFLTIGSGFDSKLENFWCNIHQKELLAELPKIGVTAVTTPNYSFFTDMMGPTKMYNFRRILLATEALAEAGVTAIPHLNALTQRDWDNWYSFLKSQPNIRFVAKEFGTGLASFELGASEIRRLAEVQERLGYPLHLIAIGGIQFVQILKECFPGSWTVTDSDPFMKTVKRQAPFRLRGAAKWRTDPLPKSASLDERLKENIKFSEDSIFEPIAPASLSSVAPMLGQIELVYGLS